MEEWGLGTMTQVVIHLNATTLLLRVGGALAQWSSIFIFITMCKRKFSRSITALCAVISLILSLIYMAGSILVMDALWFPSLAGSLIFMILLLWFLCEVSVREAAYYGMLAFMISEFEASLALQIYGFNFGMDEETLGYWFGIMIGIYAATFVLTRFLLRKYVVSDRCHEFSKWDLAIQWGFSILTFFMSNINFISLSTIFSQHSMSDFRNTRTMVSLLGVAFLFSHLVTCERRQMAKELDSVHNLLKNQYDQYKLSRDSIDMINFKYHDLKHQIAVLRSEEDPVKRAEFLDRMEAEIKSYELQYKTGNKILDTILMGKSLYGNRHGITLTCVADGTLLEFMDIMDICSIFGNALDNAMECELKIPDKEKRLIHVTVSRQRDFVLIRFENYYESELKIAKGRLQTTKEQREFHGYGIKSIRYAVQKYDGAVNITTENNWFDMKILIPIVKE